jgi:HlyD family secretion protein
MRFLIKVIVGLLILGIAGVLALPPLWRYWQARSKPDYRQAAVSRGQIISVVKSTGTVKPVLNVLVGSFVSGPIQTVYVDFNDQVKAEQALAQVDPLLYKAQFVQAKAALACANANLVQAEAKLDQAQRDWKRAESLRPIKGISDTDYDLAKANFEMAEANVVLCKATIEQNQGVLDTAKTNLDYTLIKSPVDGVILERKIDPGQTVAAAFQTPELFRVAPDMEKRIFVYASVDEADIGLIRDAQQRQQPVLFTVDAYPNDLFNGKVYQVRLNPATTQNVVTYPVVVEAPNAELKLLPGMTASLSFQIDKHDDALRVPNAALRFYPKSEQVRQEDRALLEGDEQAPAEGEDVHTADTQPSAMTKVEAAQKSNRRHVWVVEGDFLRAIEIVTGLSDDKFTEVVSGSLQESQNVVTGVSLSKP